jgi:hypothetical protein
MSSAPMDLSPGAASQDEAAPARSRRLMWVALVVTLAASVWALGDDGDAVEAAPARTLTKPAAARTSRAALSDETSASLQLPRRALQLTARPDLFAMAEAASSPATVSVAASAAPPPPPPPVTLPYTFGGRLVTEQGPSVLLHEGTQTHVLAVGGTLGVFRLEQDLGDRIEFVHLPTNERVALTPPP